MLLSGESLRAGQMMRWPRARAANARRCACTTCPKARHSSSARGETATSSFILASLSSECGELSAGSGCAHRRAPDKASPVHARHVRSRRDLPQSRRAQLPQARGGPRGNGHALGGCRRVTRAQEPHQARYTASCCVCGTRSEHGDAAPGGRGGGWRPGRPPCTSFVISRHETWPFPFVARVTSGGLGFRSVRLWRASCVDGRMFRSVRAASSACAACMPCAAMGHGVVVRSAVWVRVCCRYLCASHHTSMHI